VVVLSRQLLQKIDSIAAENSTWLKTIKANKNKKDTLKKTEHQEEMQCICAFEMS
jgi:hypothetical protein